MTLSVDCHQLPNRPNEVSLAFFVIAPVVMSQVNNKFLGILLADRSQHFVHGFFQISHLAHITVKRARTG
jgi:hypothetical protein